MNFTKTLSGIILYNQFDIIIPIIWTKMFRIHISIYCTHLTMSSKDDSRVTLEVVGEKSCKVEIITVEMKDEGLWNFTTASGSGKTQKFDKFSHNLSIKDRGK